MIFGSSILDQLAALNVSTSFCHFATATTLTPRLLFPSLALSVYLRKSTNSSFCLKKQRREKTSSSSSGNV